MTEINKRKTPLAVIPPTIGILVTMPETLPEKVLTFNFLKIILYKMRDLVMGGEWGGWVLESI